ncbi:MAG TPA: histidine--tRNA ligase [Candidatus Bathyarchaeia archaeon]|nr:histidine--tRNA ligase [Candidatus Bathyarchaeia archaeon]
MKNQNLIKPQILKGFRDFLPEEARKRQYAIDIIRKTFKLWGYEPIETPAIEYLSVFTGNIGEDEKLFYKFTDEGGRQVALRYDQTVPTCRVIAQYPDKILLPFKRYQIQTVWRAEKPQKGRYREFLQCDADIFGLDNPEADAETVALSIDIFKNLGFEKPIAIINDRALYKDIPYQMITSIDKLEKIGEKGVIEELIKKGLSKKEAIRLLDQVKNNTPNDNLKQIFKYLNNYDMEENYQFKPTLARSFSYSTGTIWEIIISEFEAGSVAGCERYDSLVSRFSKEKVPGVGFSIGFDRTIVAMDQFDLFPKIKTETQVLVAILGKEALPYSLKVAARLRLSKISTDTYSSPQDKLDKQLKYADRKGIPLALIIGPDEIKKGCVTLKNLQNKNQRTIPEAQLISEIKNII